MSSYLQGLAAESQARSYLEKKGMIFLHHRLKTPHGEIDLMMEQGNQLIIVEVKRRRHLSDGLYAVRPAQQRRIIDAVGLWQGLGHDHIPLYDSIRFDVVVISKYNAIHHLENAFWVE